MVHAKIDLHMLPEFYREMTFSSFHVTEHYDEHDQLQLYITVTGVHPGYHFATIVQGLYGAWVISSHYSAPELDAEFKDEEAESDGGAVPIRRVRSRSGSEAYESMLEYFERIEAAGIAAFEVAIAKATEAGVIGPTIKNAVLSS